MEPIKVIYELDQALESKINQIHHMLSELNDHISTPLKQEYITSNQLRRDLEISTRTEQNWLKKGILKKYKVQGKLFYKLDEVKHAIESSK